MNTFDGGTVQKHEGQCEIIRLLSETLPIMQCQFFQ